MNPLRLAHDLARVTTWWASLPDADRRTLYRPHELTRATGIPRPALPHVLEMLGWHRARRWGRNHNRRMLRVLYAPPGRRVPLPPRGRPPLDVLALFALRVTD
ncbi:hypothetical protein, partial [Aromatoleum aromaticum]|uniref:hypothetical protein n=1 Tax=Aromatoleum aromaticum TaxID=551760 RepID=UPI001B7CF788